MAATLQTTTSRDSRPLSGWRAFVRVPLAREAVFVAVALLVLELVVFYPYFSGSSIPRFDFLGAYNDEAYAWWANGSLFDPPQWMPSLWGGYPAVSNLQNSSYYLPVGIAAAFGPFTPHVSAIVSALHVAFGAVGVYVFCRRWNASAGAAMMGLVAWFLGTGFYSNAPHLDIMRAYAWLPWILLIASPKWPWRRWWAPVAALLILWQAMLGIYPGMLVALAYLVPVWIITLQILFRPKVRDYLLPTVVVGASAVLMTLIRFWPALTERGAPLPPLPDTSAFPIAMIGTFLFPYDNPVLASDYTSMISYFVPAIGLVLLAFIPFRSRLTRALLVVGGVAILLGGPFWPWHDFITQHLPGMTLSRFRASDFKFVLLFALCVLGVFAADRVLKRAVDDERARFPWARAAVLTALIAGFAAVGIRYRYAVQGSVFQWCLLVGSAALVLAIWWRRIRPPRMRFRWVSYRQLAVAAFVILTAVSGLVSINSTPWLWQGDRQATEKLYFGRTVDSLLASNPQTTISRQMPARLAVPPDPTSLQAIDTHYDRVFFTGGASVLGYVNLGGNRTFERVRDTIMTPSAFQNDVLAFWNAPGVLLEDSSTAVPSAAQTNACATGASCGPDVVVTPELYDSRGRFVYGVTASRTVPLLLNEAGYKGWRAQVCTVTGLRSCTSIPTTRGAIGELALRIPRGAWRLELDYRLPYETQSWVAFGGGVGATVVLTTVLVLLSRRRRRAAPG